MSIRNLPWLEVLILLLVVVLCWWVYATKMEWQDVTITKGPTTLARENVLLASTRLLNEFGYSTEQVQDLSFFNGVNSSSEDVIWLYKADALVEEKSFDELTAWTANGGHLILGMGGSLSPRLNTLLEQFDVRVVTDPDYPGVEQSWRDIYEASKQAAPESGDYTTPPHAGAVFPQDTSRNTSIRITRQTKHQAPQAMSIQLLDKAAIFSDDAVLSGIRHPDQSYEPDAYINVQIRYKNGIVTLLGDADMFSNSELDNVDNGAYLLELLSIGSSKTVHYFLQERNTPSLPGTLWRLFPAPVSLFALALFAWILYVASRLGPIRTELAHGRTNLISHLRARGHFWRRRGNLAAMTEPVRQAAIREIKRQYPRLAETIDTDMSDRLVIKLSQDIGCPVNQVKRALRPEPLSVGDLPDAAFVLQHILHPTVPHSAVVNRASS